MHYLDIFIVFVFLIYSPPVFSIKNFLKYVLSVLIVTLSYCSDHWSKVNEKSFFCLHRGDMKEKNLGALCSNMDILISGMGVLILLNYRAISVILRYGILKNLVTYVVGSQGISIIIASSCLAKDLLIFW